MAQDVLVVGEIAGGAISTTTSELINAAKTLAEGGTVAVTLLGSASGAAAAGAFGAGASKVFSSSDAAYDEVRADQWTAAIDNAVGQLNPGVVLFAQSPVGRDVAPRLAFRRNTAVAMDCVNVSVEGGAVKATRPCYGGNALAVYGFATSPAIATVRAKSFDAAPEGSGSGETVDLGAAAASNIEVVGMEAAVSSGLKMEEAPIVVSGGRGLGEADSFRQIEALAEAFGNDKATTGASRAAVDLGWYPPAKQVGLTGKVVTPDLYVAVAISGASQHMAGCSGSKMIVAINRDKEANIFKSAKYGIVGDWKAIVPALIDAVKAAK